MVSQHWWHILLSPLWTQVVASLKCWIAHEWRKNKTMQNQCFMAQQMGSTIKGGVFELHFVSQRRMQCFKHGTGQLQLTTALRVTAFLLKKIRFEILLHLEPTMDAVFWSMAGSWDTPRCHKPILPSLSCGHVFWLVHWLTNCHNKQCCFGFMTPSRKGNRTIVEI